MTVARTWQTEFPDFPVDTFPALPDGWADTSWHNDACPSAEVAAKHVKVWIDYLDPSMREFDGELRFTVERLDEDREHRSEDPWFQTDNWEEVLAYVDAYECEPIGR